MKTTNNKIIFFNSLKINVFGTMQRETFLKKENSCFA